MKIPSFLKRIDWDLLKQQKESLLNTINNIESYAKMHETSGFYEVAGDFRKDVKSLEGILNLIDSIQDFAVDVMDLSEDKVFNLKNKRMKKYSIPIRWEAYKRVDVEAENLQEAVEKAVREFLSIPDDEYIDDSWEVDDIICEEVEEDYDMDKLYENLNW